MRNNKTIDQIGLNKTTIKNLSAQVYGGYDCPACASTWDCIKVTTKTHVLSI